MANRPTPRRGRPEPKPARGAAKDGAARGGASKGGSAKGGRVTPKATGRYTPPIPRSQKVSPKWVPVLMFTCLGLGTAIILTNYVDVLPGGTKNLYLVIGLVLITLGLLIATRYH